MKGSVEAALQTMNLKQYQGETNTGKQPVKTNKRHDALIIGVAVSIFVVIVIVATILWRYKRKQRTKVQTRGIYSEGHRNTALNME